MSTEELLAAWRKLSAEDRVKTTPLAHQCQQRIDALILSWRQSSSLDVQQLLDELEAILGLDNQAEQAAPHRVER